MFCCWVLRSVLYDGFSRRGVRTATLVRGVRVKIPGQGGYGTQTKSFCPSFGIIFEWRKVPPPLARKCSGSTCCERAVHSDRETRVANQGARRRAPPHGHGGCRRDSHSHGADGGCRRSDDGAAGGSHQLHLVYKGPTEESGTILDAATSRSRKDS